MAVCSTLKVPGRTISDGSPRLYGAVKKRESWRLRKINHMTGQVKYIAVAVTLPLHPVYTYSVPEALVDLAVAGKRVLVPFGKRRITGYICGPGQPDGTHTIKQIGRAHV